MFEAFWQFPFLQRALVAVILVGLICAALGLFTVFNRMSFFADVIAHSALTGIAIGLLINVLPFWTALVFGVLIAWTVGFLKNKGKINNDTLLGLFLPFSMALGILLMQLKKGYTPDLMSFLFGSILTVSSYDLLIELTVVLVVGLWLRYNFKKLVFLSFDRDSAKVSGIDVERLEYWFMILTAIVVVASLQVAGIALVGALIVVPVVTAKNIAKNITQTWWLSIVFGVSSGIVGLIISYIFNVASGATIVMVSMFLFLSTFVFRRR